MTSHAPTAHRGHLQSSNSTASIFLGGVRRSWMDNPAVSRPPAVPPPSSPTSASIPTAVATATSPVDPARPGLRVPVRMPAASSPSSRRIRHHDGAPPPQPPPQPHPQSQSQSQSLPQPYLPQPWSLSDPHPPALRSPTTTGPSPPSPPSNHPAPATVPPDPPPPPVTVSTNLPPLVTQPSQPSPTPSLSLSTLQVSSARPHDSLTSPLGRDGPMSAVAAFPSPSNPPSTRVSAGGADESSQAPLNYPVMQNGSRDNPPQVPQSVQTAHAHPHVSAVARQSQVQQDAQQPQPHQQPQQQQQQQQQPHVQLYHHHHNLQQQQQQQQRVSNTQNSSPFVPTVDASFFHHSIGYLNNFVAYLERSGYNAETFEFARLQLLTKACFNQDCLYLAIHQVYCLYSYSRAEFFKLPGFTELQAQGLSVIEKVMVENSHLSVEFLRWCAHFPAQITVLMQTPAFQTALQEAALCLGRLAKEWEPFVARVFTRGFPPFVGELIEGFRITSTALAYTIFLSTCRQLPGPSDELALKKVWDYDLLNYRRRCLSGASMPKSRIRQENEEIIQMYQAIPNPNQPASSGPPRQQRPQQRQQPAGRPSAQLPNPAAPGPTVNIVAASATTQPTGILSPQPSQSPQMPVPRLPPAGPGVDPRPSNPSQASPPFASFPLPAGNGAARRVSGSGQPTTSASNTHPIPTHVTRRGPGRPRKANGAQPQPPHPISILQPRTTSSGPAQMSPPFQMLFPSQLAEAFSPRQASSPTQQSVPIPAQAQAPITVWPNGALPPGGAPGGARTLQSQQHPRPVQASHPSPPHPRLHPLSHHPPPGPPHVAAPLLPPPGYRPPSTTRPHPLRDALHQAHLRGPVNEVHAPPLENEAGLFQYMSGFAVKPVPLGTDTCAFTWQFELSRSDLNRVPTSHISSLGQRAVRAYKDGSQIHRLRCVRVSPETSEVSERTWSTTESIWPSVIYVFINDVEAFVRRRVHNGKDLPLDISHYLREGLNTVSLHFIRSAAESRDLTYAMAVEVLDITGFSRAKELAKPLASAESREQIRTRLSPGQQDDEVSIVSDNLTVDIVDPFMARVFNTPVRGRFCGHQECFDHDTWILTRASKSGHGPLKEDWKCPICHQDARPQSLVVDGFLAEVREELARTSRLETARAILVKADGSWQVRDETEASDQCGLDRTASKRKLNGANADSPASQRPKVEQGQPLITNGDTDAQSTHQRTTEVIALD